MKQLEFFINSNLPCKCTYVDHSLTAHDYKDNLIKLEKIKNLILDTGFNLSINYYFYHDKLNLECTAWSEHNAPYLEMRATFQEELKKASIPLDMPPRYQ